MNQEKDMIRENKNSYQMNRFNKSSNKENNN